MILNISRAPTYLRVYSNLACMHALTSILRENVRNAAKNVKVTTFLDFEKT